MKKINIYQGNVEITKGTAKEWESKLSKYDGISGYLSIYSDAKLDALKSVGGYLSIHSNVKLDAPNIKSVGGSLSIHSNVKLDAPNLKSVGGYLSIHSNAKLDAPNLKSVGGYLSIHSKLDGRLERRLGKNHKNNKWYLSNESSEFLLSQKGKIEYYINNVVFEKDLFDKVRKDKLTAKEVFSITNIEQRRVAYEFMDKVKMKNLDNFKILDEGKDKYGKFMRVVSFTIDGFTKPFIYLNCFCPSTGREYFLETKQLKCELAKAKSFGLDPIEFNQEW